MLFISIAGHTAQFGFLQFFENPRTFPRSRQAPTLNPPFQISSEPMVNENFSRSAYP